MLSNCGVRKWKLGGGGIAIIFIALYKVYIKKTSKVERDIIIFRTSGKAEISVKMEMCKENNYCKPTGIKGGKESRYGHDRVYKVFLYQAAQYLFLLFVKFQKTSLWLLYESLY